MAEPVILELAVNGSTSRHRNRHVPRTPAEITEAALAGIESGASIVHNHNDEPMFTPDGVHAVEPYLAAWQPVLGRHPDALLYPTMAAAARGIPVARRWAHVEELARRGMGGMTLVDPGSVNLGLTRDGAVAAAAASGPYANPLADIEYMFARSADLGAAPSISVFEPGFLRTTLAWQRAGRLPRGAMVKLYFGGELEFGLPPTATALEAYLELLEHYAGPGEPSNLDLLRAAVDLIEGLGRAPASAAQARRLLGIPFQLTQAEEASSGT
jgi:3-keto-5-aminohexanoate cleavage enzyme